MQEIAHAMHVASHSIVEESKFRRPDGIKAVTRFPHGYVTNRSSVISDAADVCSAPTLVSLIRSSCQSAADRPKCPDGHTVDISPAKWTTPSGTYNNYCRFPVKVAENSGIPR